MEEATALLLSDNKTPVVAAGTNKQSSSITGALALTAVVFLWVGQSEVAQAIQTAADFNKPYMLTWMNHTLLSLMLPLQALWYYYTRPVEDHDVGLLRNVWRMHGLSSRALVKKAAFLSALYLSADYIWYVALPHTR